MRFSFSATAVSAAVLLASTSGAALAAPHKKDAAPAATAAPGKDAAKPASDNPVVASVNGDPIRLDAVRAAAQTLPDEARSMPPGVLFPMLVNQLVDQKALLLEARKEGVEKTPEAQKAMQQAADTALQNVYLSRTVGPTITDDAIKAEYNKEYANKAGEKEVHARHILVGSEKEADDVIAKLKKGADFATLAKQVSTDKGSAGNNGGDLGWFKQGDMLPEFSAAAFAMKNGQISDKPVKTKYGWHVIQVLETRTSTPPSLDSVKDQIRQKLIRDGVRAAVDKAVAQVKVVHYNPDGSEQKPGSPSSGAGAAAAGNPPVPAQAAPATPGTSPSGE
ncbi:peptidylprolyl isomerase [Rhizosaccharibacter radicis]|uniref:Parvulin-like PPIase n=1 Tax=Rhizosaccharibacter radicis TaxID=2782605 RepID=A0ABT1VVL5_9PROT|nr:peptidylprolyl isomerase [Acetobacteraceae bacterium KSS12]